VLRIPLKSCTDIRPWTPTKTDRVDADGDVLAVVSTVVIEMKEQNTIAPYIFKKACIPADKLFFETDTVMTSFAGCRR
jgi:hypothetical protein